MAELRHYTREQVEELVGETLEILEEKNVPPELREVAFGKVFDRLGEKTITGFAPSGIAIGNPLQ